VCAETLGRDSDEWRFIDGAGGELVALLDERDQTSHTYRYPAGRDGRRHQRPRYVVSLDSAIGEVKRG
jgi:hypothetical protein